MAVDRALGGCVLSAVGLRGWDVLLVVVAERPGHREQKREEDQRQQTIGGGRHREVVAGFLGDQGQHVRRHGQQRTGGLARSTM